MCATPRRWWNGWIAGAGAGGIFVAGFFLVMDALSDGRRPAPPTDPWPPGPIHPVSVYRLLGSPDELDGHRVRIIAYFVREFEGTGLFATSEDADRGIAANGIALGSFRRTLNGGQRDHDVPDRGYVIAKGRFTAGPGGHRGMWSGTLEDINRFASWGWPPQQATAPDHPANID